MQGSRLIEILEAYAPVELAESWDNPGLLVGDKRKEVKKITIALDATDEVVKEAVQNGSDFLITHHPLIFKGMKKVVEEDFIGRRIRSLIRHDISLYAMHTNCDIAAMADAAGTMMELTNQEVLAEERDGMGIGKVGLLKESMTLAELADKVKEVFEVSYVQVAGDLEKKVNRVAVSPGSGHDFTKDAIKKGAQVLITGDMGHHAVIDAVAQGLMVIDAGHFGTENFMKKNLAMHLKSQEEIKQSSVEIVLANEKAPMVVR